MSDRLRIFVALAVVLVDVSLLAGLSDVLPLWLVLHLVVSGLMASAVLQRDPGNQTPPSSRRKPIRRGFSPSKTDTRTSSRFN